MAWEENVFEWSQEFPRHSQKSLQHSVPHDRRKKIYFLTTWPVKYLASPLLWGQRLPLAYSQLLFLPFLTHSCTVQQVMAALSTAKTIRVVMKTETGGPALYL
jgi:hypothetical protein